MWSIDLESFGITPEENNTAEIWNSSWKIDTNTLWLTLSSENESSENIPTWEIDAEAVWITLESEGSRVTLQTEIATNNIKEEILSWDNNELTEKQILELKKLLGTIPEEDLEKIQSEINKKFAQAINWDENKLLTEIGSIFIQGDENTKLNEEIERINALAEWENIIIKSWNVDENGNEEIIEFESKKDAYLYLYEVKYIQYSAENYTSENFWILPYALWAGVASYITFCIAWSLRRGFGKFKYRVLQRGQRITATSKPEGSGENSTKLIAEFTEYTQREHAVNLAKEIFQGNEEVLNKLAKPRYLHFIDGYIEDVRTKWIIQEQSFWRNFYNAINERGIIWKTADIFFKPYYLLSRNAVLKKLEEAARIRKEIISYYTEGKGKWEIASFAAYAELDHDVPNSEELRIRDRIHNISHSVTSGDLDYIYGMSFDEAKLEIQSRIGGKVLWSRPNKAKINAIIGDGSASNPGEGWALVQNEVTRKARFLLDISQYDEILTARALEARLNGINYNPSVIRWQLESFFASIGNEWGQNRYTYYSASSVIEKILQWIDKNTAILDSEAESWTDLRQRISDPAYIINENAAFQQKLNADIMNKAQSISNTDELKIFEEHVLDYIYEENGNYRKWFGDIGRTLERIIEEKRNTFLTGSNNTSPNSSENRESPALNREWIRDYNWLKRYVDSLYLSIIISWDDNALQRFEEELRKIITDSEYTRTILESQSIWDYYKWLFPAIDIFEANSQSFRGTSLTNIREILSQEDTRFSRAQRFTDLWELVAWITDINTKQNIIRALRDFRINKR